MDLQGYHVGPQNLHKSKKEAGPGNDWQTPSGNRQVINGQEQQEEKSVKY